jgi:tetratricopeptide (TPR) repeat protein
MGNPKKEIGGTSFEPQRREDKRSRGHQLYNQARVLMASGRHQEAADMFLESAKEEPHAKTYELLGECLMRLGNFAEAIPFLAAAITLDSGVRALHFWRRLGLK